MSEPLLSAEAIEAATNRGIRPARYQHEVRMMGVHIGRNAGEPNVIFPRQGLVALRPLYVPMDRSIPHWPVHLARRIADLWDDWRALACFVARDSDQGVAYAMQMIGRAPILVDLASRPSDSRYADRRSELHTLAGLAIIEGASLPDFPLPAGYPGGGP